MVMKKPIVQSLNERANDPYLLKGILTYLNEEKTYFKTEYWNRIVYTKIIDRFQVVHHRLDGPAIHYFNGHDIFCINGNKHRDGDWAERKADGSKFWFKHGQLHNPNGPAVIYYDTITISQYPILEFWLNGKKFENIYTTDEWIIKQIIE
jgi:hypothetical protein